MQVLLCLGIVILIVVVTGLVTLGISIMIKRDTYFLLVFSLFSVHSMCDQDDLFLHKDLGIVSVLIQKG